MNGDLAVANSKLGSRPVVAVVSRSAPSSGFLRRALKFLPGIAAVLLVVWIDFRLAAPLATTAFLCFPIIVVVAVKFGFREATLTSLVAVACLDFFFTAPLFSFRMPNPSDWVALGAFEFAGLVVSRLSTDVLDQARIVGEERGHLEKLLRFARSILLLNLHEPAGPQIAEFIDQAIEADAVALFDSATTRVHTAGASRAAVGAAAKNSWVQGGNADDPAAHIWARVLRLGHNSIGAIALRGKDLNPLVMDAVASITAVALERAHSFEKETRAEGARQSDQLRTAVLDALAHAFKTPLTAILAATSGLLDTAALSPRETDLVTLIDEESIRLNDLATRLLQTARLDSSAIKVQKNGCTLPDLIERVTDAFYAELESGRIGVDLPPNPPLLSGDCALIATALRQFVDNAVKYSDPSSTIGISVKWTEKEIVMSVHNYGPVILPEDRERIFERFYRSPGTEHRAAGTGLGLSISKKVAEAHRGRAWVVSDEAEGTTFFLALPRDPAVK